MAAEESALIPEDNGREPGEAAPRMCNPVLRVFVVVALVAIVTTFLMVSVEATNRNSIVLASTEKTLSADEVQSRRTCSKRFSENCWATGCCEDEGMSCFEKNEMWAACGLACGKGGRNPYDGQFQSPWSCNVVTFADIVPGLNRKPKAASDEAPDVNMSACSRSFEENCWDTGCCADEGYTCFMKNDDWAACGTHCGPGGGSFYHGKFVTPWTCKVITTSDVQKRREERGQNSAVSLPGSRLSLLAVLFGARLWRYVLNDFR